MILSWNIDEKVYSVSGEYEALYMIYYSLRDKLKETQYKMDTYVRCVNDCGVAIDITTGLKAARGREKLLIKRGYFFELPRLRPRRY